MDLDDSFTERLIQRSKARKCYLNEKKAEAFTLGMKRTALVEDQKGNSDDPPEESPKRHCTETLQNTYSTHDKENVEMQNKDLNADFVSYSTSKTRGLAALKRNFPNEYGNDLKTASEQQGTPVSVKCPVSETSDERMQKSLNLIQETHLEEYSDDESIDENDFAENYHDIKSDDGSNKMDLDYSSVEKVKELEKLTKPMKSETSKSASPVFQKSVRTDVDPAELPLSARKALFEKALLSGTPKINDSIVDHKLSVAQRAAMFETASKANSGTKSTNFKEPKRIALSNITKFEKRNDLVKSPVKVAQSSAKINTQEIKASCANKTSAEAVTSVLSPTKNVGNHTRFIQQKLIESSGSNWQDKQTAKAVEERKQEISSLVNHWEKLSSSSSIENNSEMEHVRLASEEKVSSESDAMQGASDSEDEYEPSDINAEEEFLNDINTKNDCTDVEIKNDDADDDSDYYDEQKCVNFIDEKTESHENVFYDHESQAGNLNSTENFSDEQNFDDVPTTSYCNSKSVVSSLSNSGKSSYADDSSYHASSSQSCNSGSSVRSFNFASVDVEQKSREISEKRENKNPEINILRTVSAYRREKQETKLTPVRTVVRREKVSSPESPPDNDYTEVIQQRLKKLQEDILKQQTVISQTSQALNLCSATTEFSGSTEQVEAERHLLIATQKRQSCLNEITRLKTYGAQGENIDDGTGNLTITDIKLPLKREFIASQLEGRGNDSVHYFLCLIRHGAQVIVTEMMSTDDKTRDGTLNFTNHIQLRKLPADFSIVFEVYALQTKKDVLPHEKKYHIKRENSKKRLTPKGKKFDGKIPAISSPGGPNAVRSPSFGVVGFTRFTIQNINKTVFTLDKVPFASPLDGVLKVQLQLHAEHKATFQGFLTFYEDVGEIGALYRRWCVLDGSYIAYWMYPDDQHKKKPMNIIDLKQCITGTVKAVSSLECARPHTFKLNTVRPQQNGDKDTLISKTVNTLTTTKHLLTADTKEERILWCNKINEALTNVRKWDPEALRPVEALQI